MNLLFICKNRARPGYKEGAYGLLNSAKFVIDVMSRYHKCNLEVVIDANDIDRVVHKHKPDYVIIEAIWVTPTKLTELQKLHPKVKWIVRVHSKIPFLSNEGIAIGWLKQYSKIKNVIISGNSKDFVRDIGIIGIRAVHLPNIYYIFTNNTGPKFLNSTIDIGCFGSIRPMKNQLIQAFAAIDFAESINKRLRFHINASRNEQNGDNVLKNLRNLFDSTGKYGIARHLLVEHEWMPHDAFLNVVKDMTLGLQVSYSESFNIVAADFVACRIPIVTSKEISFITPWSQADPNSTKDISNRLYRAYYFSQTFASFNRYNLDRYNEESILAWYNYFR